MAPLNVFVAEGNVEIYLSKLHETMDAAERDKLLRLVAMEEMTMGLCREHVENGERRVVEGRRRIEQQRTIAAARCRRQSAEGRLLETLERTQMLLEQHLMLMRERAEQARL